MPTLTGRQRYRGLLLVVWLVSSARGGPEAERPSSPSPSHDLTETTTPTTDPTGGIDPESGLPIVQLSDLPSEAAETLALIDAGGPFPEERDGSTFENREDLLPDHPLGYYKEYTVPTPGSPDRGARRIVTGEGGELYYTDDHYRSFSRIAR
jgi:ribonuclease T1